LTEHDGLVSDAILGKRNAAGHAGKDNECNAQVIAVHRLSLKGAGDRVTVSALLFVWTEYCRPYFGRVVVNGVLRTAPNAAEL
jgi:hypothetical protein